MRVLVVCEANTDRTVGCGLAERILRAAGCQDQIEWQGLENRSYLKWSNVKAAAEARRLKKHGHFSGLPGRPDAYAGRRALLIAKHEELEHVLFVRDSDHDDTREDGLRQACAEQPEIKVAIAMPRPSIESWLLLGFIPSGNEIEALEGLCTDIGFDPTRFPEKLVTGDKSHPKNAHRVWSKLVEESFDIVERCVTSIDVRTPETLSEATGLRTFAHELLKHCAS